MVDITSSDVISCHTSKNDVMTSYYYQTSETIFFHQDFLSGQVSSHLKYQNLIYDGLHIQCFCMGKYRNFQNNFQFSAIAPEPLDL